MKSDEEVVEKYRQLAELERRRTMELLPVYEGENRKHRRAMVADQNRRIRKLEKAARKDGVIINRITSGEHHEEN